MLHLCGVTILKTHSFICVFIHSFYNIAAEFFRKNTKHILAILYTIFSQVDTATLQDANFSYQISVLDYKYLYSIHEKIVRLYF